MRGLFSFLKKYIPQITRWNAGELRSIILEKALYLAKQYFGLTSYQSIKKHFQENPKDLEKFITELRVAEQFMYEDLQRARQRDVILRSMKSSNWRSNIMIAVVIIILIGGLIIMLAFPPESASASNILSVVITLAVSCLKDAFVFEFGNGSKMSISK